jgi:hypothetical protein
VDAGVAARRGQGVGLTWNNALDGGGFIVGDEVTLELDVELLRK